MITEKIANVWANSGVLTPAPSTAKQDVGWVSGAQTDRPLIEYFNYLQNRVEEKANGLIDEVHKLDHMSPHITELDLLLEYNRGNADTLYNTCNGTVHQITGGGEDFTDICAGWNYTTNKPCVYVVDNNDNTQIWELSVNSTDNTITKTARNLGTTLSAGSEYPSAIVSDGPVVYVLAVTAAGAGKIHAYDCDTWSSPATESWNASVTGTFNTHAGNVNNRIILANATKLAVTKGSETGANRLSVLHKADGSGEITGQGNVTSSGTPNGAICSNGTNLYFITGDGATGSRLGAAKISDLTAPAAPASEFNISTNFFTNCIFTGTLVVFVGDNGTIICYDLVNSTYIYNSTSTDFYARLHIRSSSYSPYASCAFDGSNIVVTINYGDGLVGYRFNPSILQDKTAAGLLRYVSADEITLKTVTNLAANYFVYRACYSNGYLWTVENNANTILCAPVAAFRGSVRSAA